MGLYQGFQGIGYEVVILLVKFVIRLISIMSIFPLQAMPFGIVKTERK